MSGVFFHSDSIMCRYVLSSCEFLQTKYQLTSRLNCSREEKECLHNKNSQWARTSNGAYIGRWALKCCSKTFLVNQKLCLMPCPSARTKNFCLGQKQICPVQYHFCPAQNFLSEVKKSCTVLLQDKIIFLTS